METEKRTTQRQAQEASLVFSRFNAQSLYDAKMVNYSQEGMYFETNELFRENTDIFFRVQNCDSDSIDQQLRPGFRTISLAQVKWWRRLRNGTNHRYGIGVKYY